MGRVAAGGLMLDATLDRQGGYLSHDEDDRSLTGATGEALTPLRPAGRARIAGQRMMVETEGDFVERGDPVKVLRVEEGRIVVRRA